MKKKDNGGENKPVLPRRMTFIKAFDEERKSWRWAAMSNETEALVLAFCACVYLRMQNSSMDQVMRLNAAASESPEKSKESHNERPAASA